MESAPFRNINSALCHSKAPPSNHKRDQKIHLRLGTHRRFVDSDEESGGPKRPSQTHSGLMQQGAMDD